MDITPQVYQKWTDRLAMDIALTLEGSGEVVSDVLARHAVDVDDLVRFKSDPLFLRKVSDLRIDVREHGVTFRMKARAQAEELLTTSWTLIHREDVSAAVKADLIKSTVKWAGLEPKGEINPNENTGGVTITINLDPSQSQATEPGIPRSRPRIIEHEGI